MGNRKYILLDFVKYLSFQKCKRIAKFLMLRSGFRKKRACSKSVCSKKALWEQVFGKWMHFQLMLSLWELEVIRDWLYIKDITETSLNRLFNVAYSCSVEKGVLKNFTGKHLFWSLY